MNRIEWLTEVASKVIPNSGPFAFNRLDEINTLGFESIQGT
jgi:hypothetical protein